MCECESWSSSSGLIGTGPSGTDSTGGACRRIASTAVTAALPTRAAGRSSASATNGLTFHGRGPP